MAYALRIQNKNLKHWVTIWQKNPTCVVPPRLLWHYSYPAHVAVALLPSKGPEILKLLLNLLVSTYTIVHKNTWSCLGVGRGFHSCVIRFLRPMKDHNQCSSFQDHHICLSGKSWQKTGGLGKDKIGCCTSSPFLYEKKLHFPFYVKSHFCYCIKRC